MLPNHPRNQGILHKALNKVSDYKDRRLDDIQEIIRVCQEVFNVSIDQDDAFKIWKHYSDSMSASWLIAQSDKEIKDAIQFFVDSLIDEELEEIENN